MTKVTESWAHHYAETEKTLENVRQVKAVATAFNTNIDAVLKISGKKLAQLVREHKITWAELNDIRRTRLVTAEDVIKGIFRCFSRGIAEEWLADDITVYNWMVENLGYDRMQMGGQGGIVANALAVCGVQKVFCHCNSLPAKQAAQFLKRDNLLSFDETGAVQPAYTINRREDTPLIHWIIEFDKNDEFELEGNRIICPKSNRFIATYDPLNFNLVMDENFVDYMNQQKLEAVVLSGYHALTADRNGVALVEGSVPVIKKWQENGTLLHLEVASTQDAAVRKAIVGKIAPTADSIGLNERETIEVLEVIGEEELAALCDKDSCGINLFEAIIKIKQKIGVRRIQMHMFGLYLTVQDKDFCLTPEQNRRGMCLAATVAAGKAGTGHINEEANLMWAKGMNVCEQGMEELRKIADYIGVPTMTESGIGSYKDFDIIAVPTILVEKPLTLVGMGDTISSISLIGALV